MSRRCAITGKGVMTGNNVSHAQTIKPAAGSCRTCSRTMLYSETLARGVRGENVHEGDPHR